MMVSTLSGRLRLLAAGLLFLLGLTAMPVFAQYDDPNLDQISPSVRQSIIDAQKQQTDAPLSNVITIDNWDNYNLGTDFGEGNIAVNPGIPKWFFTAYNTNSAHRTTNGIDWITSAPNFGAAMQGDPVVAYDSLGNLFYENMYGSTILGCKVLKSSDNGATWGTSVTAISGNDKNWIACDQTSGPYANYVYTTMTNNSVGAFARSTDHGATFTNTFAPTTQSLPGMMVCVGPYNNIQGGAVYVVTNSGSSFASTYTFYRSLDGGATFNQMSAQNFAGYVGTVVSNRNSVQGMRTRPYPFITADNSYGAHRGRLYLVYASNDPPGSGNKPDIWLRYSDDGGATWSSTPKRINDDTNPTSHHQWHPATWCDKETGKLYVQWMDTRDCPTNDSALIYATYSTDGGATFVANQQISNKKMKIDCPTCGGGGTPRYQGDYNGIVSNKKVSMANWTDFRQGSFMSVSAYFPDFAMAIDKTSDTLYVPVDSTIVNISVPGVKLYSDTVVFSGLVTPVPTTGSIDFFFRQGDKLTTFPGSKPATIKLTGSVPPATYTVTLEAKGPNGTPVHQRSLTIKVMQGTNLLVQSTAQPNEICTGSTSQLNATVTGATGAVTYSWTPTTGLTNPNIANPVASPTATTRYKVSVTDAASHTGADSVLITVNSLLPAPGTITGAQTTCIDSTENYSIDPVTGASSYSWTVPAGAVINSGQNTTSINVSWGSTSGNVSVIAGNLCGNSNPSVLPVTLVSAPVAPGAITGPASSCTNATVNFSIDEVAEASSYTWTVPADAQIQNGQGTRTIDVQWGSTAGDVTVVAVNTCGISPVTSKTVGLEIIPDPAGAITGPDTVCASQGNYNYTVAAIPQATSYVWTVPAGASITSGDGTNNIVLAFDGSATSGPVTVAGHNTCGNGTISSMNVVVKACTGIGEISKSGISVYPNPTSGAVTINLNGLPKQVEFQVLSVNGQMLHQENWDNATGSMTRMVDLSGLAKGVYYLKFVTTSKVTIEKIIVQ